VEHLKSPQDGLTFGIEASLGHWSDEIPYIVLATFRSMDNLRYWGVLGASVHDTDADTLCGNAVALGSHLACNRAYSSMIQKNIPPCAYVAILSDHVKVRTACVLKMKADWTALITLEKFAATELAVATLRKESHFADSIPNRLLMMIFERGGWNPNFPPGVDFARAMFVVLPDSRIVEEHHENLRDLGRSCEHNVTSRAARMQSLRSCGVLASRGIPTVGVDRDRFVVEF
jgi:hypothetical protein